MNYVGMPETPAPSEGTDLNLWQKYFGKIIKNSEIIKCQVYSYFSLKDYDF